VSVCGSDTYCCVYLSNKNEFIDGA